MNTTCRKKKNSVVSCVKLKVSLFLSTNQYYWDGKCLCREKENSSVISMHASV